jgi:hypothetical protein
MIQSAIYTLPPPAAAVALTLMDGTVWHTDASMPPDTAIRRALADWVAAGGVIEPYVPPPPAPLPPVSGRQFKAALALAGFITEAEMVSPDLPAAVLPALAGMTTTERIIAGATWPNLREVQGTEPLLLLFAATHTPPLGPEDIAALMATARAIP